MQRKISNGIPLEKVATLPINKKPVLIKTIRPVRIPVRRKSCASTQAINLYLNTDKLCNVPQAQGFLAKFWAFIVLKLNLRLFLVNIRKLILP